MEYDIQLRLFKKSLPLQIKLREIARLVGSAKGKVCLDAGINNAVISKSLRNRGGTWHTMTTREEMKTTLLKTLGDNVQVFDGHTMPFEDKTFDLVVISDLLERTPDDSALISECHRIIKAGGDLILDVPRVSRWSILSFVETMLGLSPRKQGLARPGYTETDLFQLIKHGFDFRIMRTYLKMFVGLVDTILQFKIGGAAGDENRDERLVRLYSRAYPFYWVAFQFFDVFLLFTKGYHIVALAKRHAWSSRKAPVLNDGRNISEAVLSKIKA